MQGRLFFLRVNDIRQQHILWGLLEIHYLERYLCMYILHLPPEHPKKAWASSSRAPSQEPWQCCRRSVLSPLGLNLRAKGSEALADALPSLCAQSCPACLGDVKHWTGAAMCNLGLHSAILLGIKFQIYNALDGTEGQLLFITVGLAAVSVCHVARLLTSSTEHTARK